MPWRVGEWHKHLPTPPLSLPDVVLNDRVAASKTMLLTQTVEDALGSMALLAMHIPIALKPRVDDIGEPIQLRSLDRCSAPVAGRNRKRQHLLHSVA